MMHIQSSSAVLHTLTVIEEGLRREERKGGRIECSSYERSGEQRAYTRSMTLLIYKSIELTGYNSSEQFI